MRIFAKITLALLIVGLLPLVVLAWLAVRSLQPAVERRMANHLQSLATVQANRASAVERGNRELFALLTTRTQLRASTAALGGPEGEAHRTLIRQILLDALESSPRILRLDVAGNSGEATHVGHPAPGLPPLVPGVVALRSGGRAAGCA